MPEPKTRATDASVEAHLAGRATPAQRADCDALAALCQRVTGAPAVMWGPSIVGFGRYRQLDAKGRATEWMETGFAVRGRELVVYLVAAGPRQAELLTRLGPHKMGNACLYLKRLADVDATVLEALLADAVAEVRRRHPG